MTISEKIHFYRSQIDQSAEFVPVAVDDLQDLLGAAEVALAMIAPEPGERLDSRSGTPCVGGAAFGSVATVARAAGTQPGFLSAIRQRSPGGR
jgi:hypothetical protein